MTMLRAKWTTKINTIGDNLIIAMDLKSLDFILRSVNEHKVKKMCFLKRARKVDINKLEKLEKEFTLNLKSVKTIGTLDYYTTHFVIQNGKLNIKTTKSEEEIAERFIIDKDFFHYLHKIDSTKIPVRTLVNTEKTLAYWTDKITSTGDNFIMLVDRNAVTEFYKFIRRKEKRRIRRIERGEEVDDNMIIKDPKFLSLSNAETKHYYFDEEENEILLDYEQETINGSFPFVVDKTIHNQPEEMIEIMRVKPKRKITKMTKKIINISTM